MEGFMETKRRMTRLFLAPTHWRNRGCVKKDGYISSPDPISLSAREGVMETDRTMTRLLSGLVWWNRGQANKKNSIPILDPIFFALILTSLLVSPLSVVGADAAQVTVHPDVNISQRLGHQREAAIASRGLACGPNLVCDPTTQYCSVFFGGPVGVPPSYACADLPEDCPSPPTCEYIRTGIGCKCAESDGRITVTCTAP